MKAICALGTLLAGLCALPAAATEPIQITLALTSVSGDWGTGIDSDRRAAVLRLAWGDKTRLRADLELVDVRSDGTLVVQTPFGPVAAGARSAPGPGPAGGGNDSGGSGGGGSGEGGSGGGSGEGGSGGSGSGDGGSGSGGSGSGGGETGASSTVPATPSGTDEVLFIDERSTGLGDLRLAVERTLVGGGARLFRLDAEVGVKVPTADEEEYLGTGELDYRVGLAGEYRLWTGTLFGGAGWNRLGDPAWARLEDVLDAYAGMASDPLAGGLVIAGWLEANQEVLAGAGDRAAAGLSLRGGGRVRWRIELTAGLSSAAEDLSAAFGVSLGGASGRQAGRRGRGG